ncbi:Uncharacterised protein [Burkholderia pseudomallei]|uniref:hypothetical protein n=1 Tax=Burkholderia pseudomallei TaxID=28450 RepID=UPI000F1E87EC|nr:hypothetical protein [Burkholderia pseudomallei]CAJ4015805.1 Uncharacterised protein [Burkholderia pseudomallei]CAJ4477180.1 Uncharacterised protein [Burkholderia pseudomallei]CAJ5859233.1 Uncharacterised protein [Burkholderia pseudomallei]CAJ6053903.1 Uncharacterised protein [Burkholderia pseudomallei]CAJ6184823.1 Uncharacterised protein [Burkholderia pseudomallei]
MALALAMAPAMALAPAMAMAMALAMAMAMLPAAKRSSGRFACRACAAFTRRGDSPRFRQTVGRAFVDP